MSNVEVSVISTFDRGQWLASALAERGYKVKLMDTSSHMGRWAPEDWEGPYGYFQLENLSQLQQERVTEEDYFEAIDEGLVLWLKSGPFELKGPLLSYSLDSLGLQEAYELLLRYYKKESHFKESHFEDIEHFVSHQKFDRTWLIYLAYFYAANHYRVGDFQLSREMHPISLQAPYKLRRSTRRGLEKSFQWCESKGVECLRDVRIKDVSLTGKTCEGLEISSAWSGVVKSDFYVWMLTGEETSRFGGEIGNKLFPNGVLRSQWSWLRYRFSLNSGLYESLPIKFVVIEDVFLPWTHENFCLVQKGVSQGDLDCYIRVPSHQRFQRVYLESMRDKLLNLFKSRIPADDIKLVNMPQDYLYEEQELGPPRFPVYDSLELSNYRHKKFQNLFFSNPELWCSQDLSRQMKLQETVLDQIDRATKEGQTKQDQEVSL